MLKAFIRYTLFEIPAAILKGYAFIFFNKEEIVGSVWCVRKQWRPDIRKQVLRDYLNKCHEKVQGDDE